MCPIPEDELFNHFSLFIRRQQLGKMLFIDYLYRQILDVHGIVAEFGVRWGRNLALFESLRGIYEPFNYNRKIIGFDTWSGFPSVHKKDGTADISTKGAVGVTPRYEEYLTQILDYHEQESPVAHIKKYELIKGDASKESKRYFREHPETIIALAYFDLDIYEPTKACLEALKPHLTKGSIIGFDELNASDHPGETIALREALGLGSYHIKRSPHGTAQSYLVIE